MNCSLVREIVFCLFGMFCSLKVLLRVCECHSKFSNKLFSEDVSFILDEQEFEPLTNMKIGFEIPNSFANPDKYMPSKIRDDAFDDVPSVVASAIFDSISIDVPIDPITIFLYLKSGRLPEFVIAFFMQFELPKRKLSNLYLFYRALHLASMFRKAVMIPQDHFMSDALDAVSVQAVDRRAGEKRDESTVMAEHEDDEEEPVLVIDEDRDAEEED